MLDGLGPLGDQDHSDREYILRASLVERCQLLALSLLEASPMSRQRPKCLRPSAANTNMAP